MENYSITNAKIFITGGAGFIATRLATVLAEHNEVVLYDNLHNDAYKNTPLNNHPNVEFIQGDVLDMDALASAVGDDVNYIIHCAAIAGVGTVLEDPMRTLRVNILGTFNTFEVAKKLKNLKRIVDFSTSEVFGQYAYNAKEDVLTPSVSVNEPRWTYAVSKLTSEFVAHAHHLQSNMPTVTVRPFNVYGPNQVGVGAIHHFILNALAGTPLSVHNEGTQIRSWCYVDDFVQGLLLTLFDDNAVGKTYNIGNPQSTLTVYDLAQRICRLVGSQSDIENKHIEYQDVHIRTPNIDAIRALGYEPQISLETGLDKTIAWYREAHEAKIAASM